MMMLPIFKPLKRREIRLLWGGQVLSSMGDEIYKVAVVWLAAQLIGTDAGYVTAVQAASVLVVAFFGGLWADGWNCRTTMIRVDVCRAIAVAVPPIMVLHGSQPSLWVLVPMIVVVSSLSAFFDPALRAVLPELVPERGQMLSASTGLMESTFRFARVLGPGLIAGLGKILPLIHFFTLDALSFLISAWSIASLGPGRTETHGDPSARKRTTLFNGAKLVRQHPLLHYITWSNAITNAAWYLVFPLAIALKLRAQGGGHVDSLAMIVAAYGAGNVSSNLFFGSIRITRPATLHFVGKLVVGAGFLGIAAAEHQTTMMLSAAFAAMGGPMTDLSFLAIIQARYKTSEMPPIFRFDMVLTHFLLLIALALSPRLFKMLSISGVIALSGTTMCLCGIVGLALRNALVQPQSPRRADPQ